jgi:hypothetical protein
MQLSIATIIRLKRGDCIALDTPGTWSVAVHPLVACVLDYPKEDKTVYDRTPRNAILQLAAIQIDGGRDSRGWYNTRTTSSRPALLSAELLDRITQKETLQSTTPIEMPNF